MLLILQNNSQGVNCALLLRREHIGYTWCQNAFPLSLPPPTETHRHSCWGQLVSISAEIKVGYKDNGSKYPNGGGKSQRAPTEKPWVAFSL